MSSEDEMREKATSQAHESSSFEAFLRETSRRGPGLEGLISSSLSSSQGLSAHEQLTTFSLLLMTLNIPGPFDLFFEDPELGRGAQFYVSRRAIRALSAPRTPGFRSRLDIAAIKIPKFTLKDHERLDLSSITASRQIRHMLLEITALCHPKLRSHANIVNLIAWGTDDGNCQHLPFIALEIADCTLADFFPRSPVPSVTVKHHILLDVAAGLDAVHDVDLIHGDLKPDNILIFWQDARWTAKIADFAGGMGLNQADRLEGMGTAGWRAPELCHLYEGKEDPDPSLLARLDAYSYGLVLWSVFLRDDQSAPCSEKVDARELALSELDRADEAIPSSLRLSLKASLQVLLDKDPKSRPERLTGLLDDSSIGYSDREGFYNMKRKPESIDSTEEPTDQSMGQMEWEILEIGPGLVPDLHRALPWNNSLSPDFIEALILRTNFYGRRVYHDKEKRNCVLTLLQTGIRLNSKLSKSLICLVYEHFDILVDAEIRAKKYQWMSSAVAHGAFYLRQPLSVFSKSLLEISVQAFREWGGYNRFYGQWDGEVISNTDHILRSSGHIESISEGPHGPPGDNITNIASSPGPINDSLRKLGLLNIQELDIQDECGQTGLFRACMAGAASTVLYLLSEGANPSIIPSEGSPTCLHWLFHFEVEEMYTVAQSLMAHGANINSISYEVVPAPTYPFTLPLGSPLHWAVDMSAVDAVRVLLSLGADPSFRDGSDPYTYDDTVREMDYESSPSQLPCSIPEHTTLGFSAIDLAARSWNSEILGILLSSECGFDPLDSDEEGYTAVHRLDAGQWRYTAHGSAVWCPLYQGSRESQRESLKKTVAVLCSYGFEVDRLSNPRDDSNSARSALMNAVMKEEPELVKVLLEAGADPNFANTRGQTALSSFSRGDSSYNREAEKQIVLYLLSANANVHVRDRRGRTPLLCAAYSGKIEVVRILIENGANLLDRLTDKTNLYYGCSFLSLLIIILPDPKRTSEFEDWVVEILRSYIVTTSTSDRSTEGRKDLLERADLRGGNLLHYAARVALVKTCSFLLQSKVNVNGLRKVRRFRQGGVAISYETPLDVVLERRGNTYPDRLEPENVAHRAVYDGLAQVLMEAGGVRGKNLAEPQFIPNVPIPKSRNYDLDDILKSEQERVV